MNKYAIFTIIIYILMSFIAFISYGSDKRKAKNHNWRTKESVLLSLGFFGGACGAILGMNVFRHKTKHWYFWAINLIGLALQIALLLYLLFM